MAATTAAVVGGFTTAVATAVASALTDISMRALSRKLKYCRNIKKNMDTLRKRVEKLNHLKTDVESRKRNLRRGRMMKKEVQHWLSSVKIINDEVQMVEKLCSALPRACRAKAWLGKTILRKIDEVENLCRQGKSFDDIGIDTPSTPGAKLPCFARKKKFKKQKVGVADLNQLKDDIVERPGKMMKKKVEHLSVKESFKKLKHALDSLNYQKEKVERLKSEHENAGEVVREEVNDWLLDVRSINVVIQILKDAFARVSRCDIHKFKEIVLEKSHAVNNLLQRGAFPDGIVIYNRRKPKRG